jgi:hypothetical protein
LLRLDLRDIARRMGVLIGPVIVLSGFGLYLASNVLLGRFRRLPFAFLAVSLTGAAYAVARALLAPSVAATVSALVSVTLLGGISWMWFYYSMYGKREARPRVGDSFPEFQLPASDDSLYVFAAADRKRRLLIFYRGSW